MKKVYLTIIVLLCACAASFAQIDYYYGITAGKAIKNLEISLQRTNTYDFKPTIASLDEFAKAMDRYNSDTTGQTYNVYHNFSDQLKYLNDHGYINLADTGIVPAGKVKKTPVDRGEVFADFSIDLDAKIRSLKNLKRSTAANHSLDMKVMVSVKGKTSGDDFTVYCNPAITTDRLVHEGLTVTANITGGTTAEVILSPGYWQIWAVKKSNPEKKLPKNILQVKIFYTPKEDKVPVEIVVD